MLQAHPLPLQHAMMHKHYGRALKFVQKQAEEKGTKELDDKSIEVPIVLLSTYIADDRIASLVLY